MTPQCERILDYMKRNGSITQDEAHRFLSCARLASRVHDLKDHGIKIDRRLEKGINQFGELCYYARYILREAS